MISSVDRNQRTTTFAYDDRNSGAGGVNYQVTTSPATSNPATNSPAKPVLPEVYWEYDSAGHQVRQWNDALAGDSNSYDWVYDALGRPVREVIRIRTPASLTAATSLTSVARTWACAGPVTTFVNRNGARVETRTDYAARTQTTKSFLPGATTPGSSHYEQAIVELYSDGTPKSASNEVPSSATQSSYLFQYDALGRRTQTTSQYANLPDRTFRFENFYDAAGRAPTKRST